MEQGAYGTIFENVADALLIHCPNSGKILEANDRFCDLSGYDRDELVGKSVDRVVTGQELYRERITPEALAHLSNGEPLRTEWDIERRDGKRFPVEVHVKLVELDGSERALSSVRDISERRESQRQRHRFQRAIEAAGHAVYITDTDGHIEYVNPAFEEMTGYSPGEVIGQTPAILDAGVHEDAYFETLWNTIESGDIWNEEIINERRSGDIYHARQTIAPLYDEEGDVDGYVAIQTDITEQKRQQRRFRAMLEQAMALIAVFEPDGTIDYVSPSIERFLGYEPETMVGDNIEAYVHPDDCEPLLDRLETAVDNPGEPVRGEERMRHSNGSWRVFESIVNNQLDNPAVEGIVVNSRDVTERADRERQLRVLDRLLRHNLRNDMTVITALTEQIAMNGSPELRSAAERILDTVDGLMATAEKERLVVDIISKRADRERFDAVPRIRHGVTSGLDGQNADVTVDLPETAEVVALPEIQLVIAELVENGIVHATDNAATVTVTGSVDSEYVDVHVEDEAPPIPDEEVEVLATTDIDALNHGSGIGLWLVNWVVSHSEGALHFERSEDGNVVTVRLPRPAH